MCSRSNCARCGKPSYVGCGMHVEQVLHDVALADRCHCREQARSALPAQPTNRESWFRKLLGLGGST